MAIRHRNNSLFYRSQRGARVGDIYMTLIHTTELQGENPFHYLTELMRHESAVAEDPAAWLPWNYRDTLTRLLRDVLGPRCATHPLRPDRVLWGGGCVPPSLTSDSTTPLHRGDHNDRPVLTRRVMETSRRDPV